MSEHKSLGEAFRAGQADAKIKSKGDAWLRVLLVGGAIGVAWSASHSWLWRFVVFVVIMFLIGVAVQVVDLLRGRRPS